MWQDELTSVNGTSLTYDANGNVLTYGNMEFEWTNGRTLSQITVNPEDENGTADVYSYTYDESGIRSSKTVNGVTTYFTTKDGVIQSQTDGTNTMYFQYDNSGNPTGFIYNGTQYFYLTNQMGDVIGITDAAGSLLATYTYGAWGEVLATTPATPGSSSQLAIADANPLRYRGYYLDQETGYYYLQSRYYHSSISRFLNADNVNCIDNEETLATHNIFKYCDNDPVNDSDYNGQYSTQSALNYAKKYWQNYNSEYIYDGMGNDCASFVSQCLHAGGWKMTPSWYYLRTKDIAGVFGSAGLALALKNPTIGNKKIKITRTWGAVKYLREYIRDNRGRKEYVYSSWKAFNNAARQGKIQPGDVMFQVTKYSRDWHGHSKGKNEAVHAMLVGRIIKGKVCFYGHSNSRGARNKPSEQITKGSFPNGIKIVVFHINRG